MAENKGLLAEIAELEYNKRDDHNGYYGYKWEDVPNDWRGKVQAYKEAAVIIFKIREVVEGAELTDENPYNGEALKIRHRNATLKKGKLLTRQDIYEAGAEALKQAILKAMDKEER